MSRSIRWFGVIALTALPAAQAMAQERLTLSLAPAGDAAGVALPSTITPRVDARRASVAVHSGYDSARRSGTLAGEADVRIWGPVAFRAGFTYVPPHRRRQRRLPAVLPGPGLSGRPGDKLLKIKKIDASKISTLPHELQDPEGGIRCGYVSADRDYKVPGLGDPNVDESSSVFVLDITAPQAPQVIKKLKTGLPVGQVEEGIATFGGSHPNAVAIGSRAAYVSNGNNDSISIINTKTLEVVRTVPLAIFRGKDSRLKGLQPVSVALSPDEKRLYVAEAGINAVAVLSLDGDFGAKVEGHIPVGWWPASVKLSGDGKRLFVSNAKGRGAPPNTDGEGTGSINGHPKFSVLGTVHVIDVPDAATLARWTERVMINSGFVEVPLPRAEPGDPIPADDGVASDKIKHVIFITKENLTHDLVLGDVLRTRQGETVNGDPRYALGYDGAPNHHELALQFAFSDNFYLEPTVSSDGHRWLVNNPTTEFEETHWPASYGSKRSDSGDNAEVIENWFGRVGFTDADGSVDPHDYPQHGNLFMHLARHNKLDLTPYTFVPPNVTPAKTSWARMTRTVDFSEMDADEVDLRAAIMRSEGLPRKFARPFKPLKPAQPIFR